MSGHFNHHPVGGVVIVNNIARVDVTPFMFPRMARNQGLWKEAEELQANELETCSRVLG
jgi:hypothetical protein